MGHHKRGRPKNRRDGCLFCKPWKVNGYGRLRVESERFSDHRRRMEAMEAIQNADITEVVAADAVG